MDIAVFNAAFTTTVSRFELYPAGEPIAYVVGFTVTCKANQKVIYRDTQVELPAAADKSDEEITAIAWAALKDNIQGWAATVINKPAVVQFVPESF